MQTYMRKRSLVELSNMLDDDFLVNISAEVIDEKLTGYIRIRSKVKGIVVSLGEKIKQIQ